MVCVPAVVLSGARSGPFVGSSSELLATRAQKQLPSALPLRLSFMCCPPSPPAPTSISTAAPARQVSYRTGPHWLLLGC